MIDNARSGGKEEGIMWIMTNKFICYHFFFFLLTVDIYRRNVGYDFDKYIVYIVYSMIKQQQQ